MPRAAAAVTAVTRTTFALVATAGLLPTFAFAGPVPIGPADVVPSNPTGARFAMPTVTLSDGDALLPFIHMNARTFDTTGFFAPDAQGTPHATAEQPNPIANGRTPSSAAEETHRDVAFESPVAVPLPGPLWTSLIGLATAAWAKRRLKRGRRNAERGIRTR